MQESPHNENRTSISLPSSNRQASVTLGPRGPVSYSVGTSGNPRASPREQSRSMLNQLEPSVSSPQPAVLRAPARHIPNVLPNRELITTLRSFKPDEKKTIFTAGFFSPRRPNSAIPAQLENSTRFSRDNVSGGNSIRTYAGSSTARDRSSVANQSDNIELEIHSKARSSDEANPPSHESQLGLTSRPFKPNTSNDKFLDSNSAPSTSRRTSNPNSSRTSMSRPPTPLGSSTIRRMRQSFKISRDGRTRADFVDLGNTPGEEREDFEWAAQAKSHNILPPVADEHPSLQRNHSVVVAGSGWDGKGTLVMSASGKPTRRYKLHPGSNRFFLRGRILTSRDSIWTFVGSLGVAVCLPVLFLVFNAGWLWQHYEGGGGKAVVIIFAYFTLMYWVNMLRTAWSDPGICELPSLPPTTDVTVPLG